LLVEEVEKEEGKKRRSDEASTCFMARDVSQKYQLQKHRPQEQQEPAQSL